MNDERDMLEKLRAGDEAAFNQLVRDNQKNVHMLALRLVVDPEEALDISQRVFIKAYKGLKNFRGDSTLSTWLYRITYNLCMKHLKSARLKRFLSLDGGIIPEPTTSTPYDKVLRDDFRESVGRALETLPPRQKAVFTLHHLQGLKMKEIADIMELKVGTVKALHYHAVRKLRDALQEWKGTKFAM